MDKQSLPINFAQGIDTKTDPKQLSPGKFLTLQNTVFQTQGLMQKRNGNKRLPDLPDDSSVFCTTFNGNLTAIGETLNAFSQGSQSWVNKGTIRPLELDTLSLIRSNTNQSQADTAISPGGLVCTVFTDDLTATTSYKYAIADVNTGQNITPPTAIPVSSGTVTGSPKVFILGKYFVIVFTNIITATPHLQYIAISFTDPTSVAADGNITSQYINFSTVSWDGIVINDILFLAWNGSDVGGAIRMATLSAHLSLSAAITFPTYSATIMSVTADYTTPSPVVYASFYDSSSTDGFVLAVNQILGTVLAPTQIVTGEDWLNITAVAQNMILTVFYETENAYSYDSGILTNFISKITVTQAGVVGTPEVIARSVGLASKAFISNELIYLLSVYDSPFQPTYFLIDEFGKVLSKLAYSNASGYFVLGLPSVSVEDNVVQMSYIVKDLIQAVNKEQGLANPAGVYAQTGISLVTFTIGTSDIVTAEIANNLHLTGGFLWMYDGYSPVEHGFHLWPDSVEVTTSTSGGFLEDQDYFYQVTYEWADNQGNIFRSAPSIPVKQTTAGGDTSSNTIDVPTLRLTYKTANPVKIVIYRWSTAQQSYYQVTSISAPLMNNTAVDSVQFVDTLADSSILGNNLIYTTGGVIENIAAPACSTLAIFKSRLILVDAEDPNLLWYSKQVIESVPVEMSDLFTIFVNPSSGIGASTGKTKCAASMDDKLILFKQNAIYYLTGNGPDNTGANNDFSEPTFITSTVGCENQKSIVFTPLGIMFQSALEKGIWLLGRDLSTSYIGAPVELYNDDPVVSAQMIPGTNQVRFSLRSGVLLMYDYYYDQWGTFTNMSAVSSTIYQKLYTYINSLGQVFQENPGIYLDGSRPVLMKFITGWLNLAGVQGFQRAYFFYLLGEYITPHKIQMQIAYDYNPTPLQSTVMSPSNFDGVYGTYPIYGSSATYGVSSVEQERFFLEKQKCQAFQLTLDEIYDSTFGVAPGAGFTLSGVNLVVGIKKTYVPLGSAQSVG